MRRTTGRTKVRQKRGTGEGADYRPWIRVREVSSIGTSSHIVDWKHGRTIETLSRNETYWYYILRWEDDVVDIREQFPLDRKKTEQIARLLGVKHPLSFDPDEQMTTDFLVTYKNGAGKVSYKAFSVKANREQIFGDLRSPKVRRQVELQNIEMAYWRLRGIPFKIIFGDADINTTYAINISMVVENYDAHSVRNRQDLLCYLIAHKYIEVDMCSKPLDFPALTKQYLETEEQRKRMIASIVLKQGLNKKWVGLL